MKLIVSIALADTATAASMKAGIYSCPDPRLEECRALTPIADAGR